MSVSPFSKPGADGMRWSIVRLIWLREMRDQLRDRRTILMIFVLPLLIYPLGGIGLMQVFSGLVQKRHSIGIIGAQHLPQGQAGADPIHKHPYPPLLTRQDKVAQFVPDYFGHPSAHLTTDVLLLDPPPGDVPSPFD